MKQSGQRTVLYQVIESGSLSGSGRMVASICRGLDPGLFDITLIYAVRPETTRAEFEALFPGHVAKVFVPEMVRSICPKKDIAALRKLYSMFRANRPHVVHAHSSKAGFLARAAAWAARVPRIFYSPHGYSFRMTDTSLLLRAIYFGVECVASRVGFIVANGPSEAMWARRLTNRKRVLPIFNGIDIPSFTPRYPSPRTQNLTVAACGRITAARNPEAFVRLATRLAPEFPHVTFVWIGGGGDEPKTHLFLELSHPLRLDGRLRLTGWLPQEEAHKELANTDVVIHFSDWDVLPTAVLEAMALGKPVVGSPAVDQIVPGVTGFLARNEEELARHTRTLLRSTELRAAIGERARKVVEQEYSLARLVSQLEAAYKMWA